MNDMEQEIKHMVWMIRNNAPPKAFKAFNAFIDRKYPTGTRIRSVYDTLLFNRFGIPLHIPLKSSM